MNLLELKKKLLAAARSSPPDDQVPYAFEKRIMARLSALPKPDEWLWWGIALWRGAAACAAVSLLVIFFPLAKYTTSNHPADLEETVLASVNEADPAW